MEDIFEYVDIYLPLKMKYGEQMKPEIIGVALLQSKEGVMIEIVEERITEKGYYKTTVRKNDMNAVMDERGEEMLRFFNPEDTIEENVERFLHRMDPLSMITVTDLFHQEARERILMRQSLRSIRPEAEPFGETQSS